MQLRGVIFEDFINYKKPCMILEFPYCSFKCGKDICQNAQLNREQIIDVPIQTLVQRYIDNPITESILCQGLEPLDSFQELMRFIKSVRQFSNDDIVIFTGYNKDEIASQLATLQAFKNIIVKFGRYLPNQNSIYDDILGATLASNNQYAEKIS